MFQPTSSGKTVLCKKLIDSSQRNISPAPQEIIYSYGIYQPLYDEMKKSSPVSIKFVEGQTDVDDIPRDGKPRLMIIDDQILEANESKKVSDIFLKFSHHLNISIVLITQCLFMKGQLRTISLNVQYMFLLQSVRDTSVISALGRQLGNSKFLKECYDDVMKTEFGHLFFRLESRIQ
jgi:hypothetical protein